MQATGPICQISFYAAPFMCTACNDHILKPSTTGWCGTCSFIVNGSTNDARFYPTDKMATEKMAFSFMLSDGLMDDYERHANRLA